MLPETEFHQRTVDMVNDLLQTGVRWVGIDRSECQLRGAMKRGRLVNASDVDRRVSSLSVAGDGSNGKCPTPTANLINRERPDNSH